MDVANKVLLKFGVEKAESLLVLTVLSLACLLGSRRSSGRRIAPLASRLHLSPPRKVYF